MKCSCGATTFTDTISKFVCEFCGDTNPHGSFDYMRCIVCFQRPVLCSTFTQHCESCQRDAMHRLPIAFRR